LQRPRNLRPAWASVDLTAIRSNVRTLRASSKGRRLRAILKADAYGHGAIEIARVLAAEGINHCAVALVEEGIELRQAGIEGSILSMGIATPGQCDLAYSHRLLPAISSLEQLDLWIARAATSAKATEVHLKVNTGMNRLGLAPDELPEALLRVRRQPQLLLSGLMSHFADADIPESSRTHVQLERFVDLLALLTPDERAKAEIHIGNSAARLHHDLGPSTAYRPGLALFGYDPTGGASNLRPALSVHGRIVRLHRVEIGERVGYGGQWVAERSSRIGIVPLGYADGYSSRLGSQGEVLVKGRRAPLVGTISMDMLAIDLTEFEAGEGDDVLLLGTEGDESIDAFELAHRAETPIYEILCGFGLRLPKLFLDDGKVVSVSSRFGATGSVSSD
jgi:alanine racemase